MKDEILSRLQRSFPLVPRPYAAIAEDLGISEQEVIAIVQEQKRAGVIRQTSAIFDTKRLGYQSSLVAFEVDSKEIDKAVEIINAHPGVSHNYERNHTFNIWFTMAVEGESELGLEGTIKELAQMCGAKEYIILPTLKMFKISVKLNTTGKDAKKERPKHHNYKDIELTPLHVKVIQKAQYDTPVVSEPFRGIIEALEIDYDTFFATLQELQDSGVMRRFATILNHRKAGFNANAMVVWDVDEQEGESIGKNAAAFSAVSHCYLRPKYANWPYNLFTMVHGKTTEQTDAIIEEMAKEIPAKKHKKLYSSREFKKVRIEYFTPRFKEWEAEILAKRGA